jgi:tetratricopeptide (TPR) repeat protein
MSLLGNINGFIGYVRHIRGHWGKALSHYEKGYRQGMGYRFQLGYGLGLLRSGDFERSKDIFSKIILSPAAETIRSHAKYNQGLVYWKLGLIDDAHATMEEAFQKTPNAKSYGALGYFKILTGDLSDALAFNKKAFEYDDEDPVILDNMGMIYYEMGDMDQALSYFQKAEEAKSDQVSTLFNLGRVHRKRGETDLAREKLERALAGNINPLSAVTREEIEKELSLLG